MNNQIRRKRNWLIRIVSIFVVAVLVLRGLFAFIFGDEKCDSPKIIEVVHPKSMPFTLYEVLQYPDNAEQNNFTIASQTSVVSIYLELAKSKHSTKSYDAWINDMAHSVTSSPLAIVVNRRAYLKLSKMRKNYVTKFYVVEDVWSIWRELERERNKSYIENYMKYQRTVDMEAFLHTPELYAIWNLKSYLMHKISIENPFSSKFFIYTDSGAFRTGRPMLHWPDQHLIENFLLPRLKDRVLVGQISRITQNTQELLNKRYDLIEGGFMAGSARAVQRFYKNFFYLHDMRFDRQLFIGKDQEIMNLMAFKYFNHTLSRLNSWLVFEKCRYEIDPWFFYLNFLSKYDRCSMSKQEFIEF